MERVVYAALCAESAKVSLGAHQLIASCTADQKAARSRASAGTSTDASSSSRAPHGSNLETVSADRAERVAGELEVERRGAAHS